MGGQSTVAIGPLPLPPPLPPYAISVRTPYAISIRIPYAISVRTPYAISVRTPYALSTGHRVARALGDSRLVPWSSFVSAAHTACTLALAPVAR
eukprot:2194654-Rhodomonas_salina.1